MNTYTKKAPAKINIGLRILSKRSDGYHSIETIFYPVKIFDVLKLRITKSKALNVRNKIKIGVTNTSGRKIKGLQDKDNICFRAVEHFFQIFKITGQYSIDLRIVKNIPTGAGLGGGSSDAAAVLKILSGHFRLRGHVPEKLMNRIALRLGSDVPFFLTSRPAYATSRGEKIVALPDFKAKHKILIVNPGIHVSTQWAYEGLRMNSEKSVLKKKFAGVKSFTSANSVKLYNDFEKVVFRKYPEIGMIKIKMYEFSAEYSLMSGSGSTVYGFFKKEADLKSAQKYFQNKKYKTFVS